MKHPTDIGAKFKGAGPFSAHALLNLIGCEAPIRGDSRTVVHSKIILEKLVKLFQGVKAASAGQTLYIALIQQGDYYRLSDPFQDGPYTAWEHVSANRREALVSLVTGGTHAAPSFLTLRLKGLEPDAVYRVNGGEECYSGSALMAAGYPLPQLWGDYQSLQLYLKAEA